MNRNQVISVKGVSKKYQIRSKDQPAYTSLREELPKILKSMVFSRSRKEEKKSFWALKDISFEVNRGDILGIIGPNGAGKSTLLKILSQVTAPTTGKIEIKGRLSALLEVGTGFHPELTGRENIYLSGSILGMKNDEIKSKLEEIVEFAEVEKFLDTPLKRYSSGMRVRLGFAVAAFLEPEILLVDEVLAVGDIAFQKKCLGQMENVAKGGRTILFISHNIGMVKKLCRSCISLYQGSIIDQGEVEAVTENYLSSYADHSKEQVPKFRGELGPLVQHKSVYINEKAYSPGSIVSISPHQPLSIEIEVGFEIKQPFRLNVTVIKENLRLFTAFDGPTPILSKEGIAKAVFKLPSKILRPGYYSISYGGITDSKYGAWFWMDNVILLNVLEEWGDGIDFFEHGAINFPVQSERLI